MSKQKGIGMTKGMPAGKPMTGRGMEKAPAMSTKIPSVRPTTMRNLKSPKGK